MNRHRLWRLLLFLAVLILPSIGIVVQSRKIAQDERDSLAQDKKERDREERGRAVAEEERTAAEIGQSMYESLEVVKLKEKDGAQTGIPQTGAVVLLGRMDGVRLAWPWETRKEQALPLMEDWDFAQTMEEARRLRPTDVDRAADLYRTLIESERNPRQRAVARLGLGQMLAGARRPEDAFEAYRQLLSIPWNLTDELNIQIASYAAQYVTKKGVIIEAADVKRALESQHPVTLHEHRRLQAVLELLRKSEDASVREYVEAAIDRVSARIVALEAPSKLNGAAALQKDFPDLRVTPSLWKPYTAPGGDLWLVGKASDSPLVLVVRAEAIRREIESDRGLRTAGLSFQISAGSEGKPMGSHFPDLRAIVSPTAIAAGSKPPEPPSGAPLYSLWLWVAVPFTFLGGYLVWNDTRREVRVADMRSQFVSSVSHELKTPLTAIRMFAETLQFGGNDARTQDEYLETIVNESERLTRLLNNVLDFSRIERGQKTYTLEPTPLAEVLDAAVRTMRYPLAEKGFVLSVSVSDGIPPVAADRDALQQAVLNLLTNAMKYSGKRREIELRLTANNGSASIEVTDHGIGIPAKEQPYIFEKFYRAHVPENKAIAGTGLGLALVAHVAQAHGGSVRVESNPGEGSTFSIRLPLNGAAA